MRRAGGVSPLFREQQGADAPRSPNRPVIWGLFGDKIVYALTPPLKIAVNTTRRELSHRASCYG
jgi:hypothetical protein